MSEYDQSEELDLIADDQSEDGEMKSPKDSPMQLSKDDALFTMSEMSDEENEDTTDSLDIKPPQAMTYHHQVKTSRPTSRSNSARRDKHSDREGRRDHSGHMTSHNKGHHRAREHRDDRTREKRHGHRERREAAVARDVSNATRSLSESLRLKEKAADRVLEDLRERLLDKRRVERAGEVRINERIEERGDVRSEGRGERIMDRQERRIKVEQSRERHRERERRGVEVEVPPPARETVRERDVRRERLLEADREMVRQKEVYRRELEERRERRYIEKEKERERSRSRERKKVKLDDELKEKKEIEREESTMVVTVSSESEQSEMEAEGDEVEAEEVEEENASSEGDDEEDSDSKTDTDEEVADTDESPGAKDRTSDGAGSASDGGGSGSASEGAASPEHDEEVKAEVVEAVEDELPPYLPAVSGCRSVEEFQCLNRIEEGTYGVVYRARDRSNNEVVALKRLKMEKEKEGFPITSLREINTLLKAQHKNIVTVREIVVGSNMDKIFIVMDYVEHDLKSLMETMKQKKQVFIPGEVKCLMQQLLRAVAHLHDNWILHRDLKTSNLLLSHKGILKVGDFGLAREYGSPLKAYTPIVVTLWYRSPELLLCTKEYSTPIDMWSVGCIFGEFLSMEALFPGKSEVDQINRIFKDLGTPNEKVWPGYGKLPAVQKMTFQEYPVCQIRKRFGTMITEVGLDLISKFLCYDPAQRVTAEDALRHGYFEETPLAIDPAMFPTWPAKSELAHRKAAAPSPKPPPGGAGYKQLGDTDEDLPVGDRGFHMGVTENRRIVMGAGFSLKF